MKKELLKKRGFILVMVLLFLSLISILLVAFLMKSQDQRLLSQYYTQNMLADLEVSSAAEMLIGEIRENIRDSSEVLSLESTPTTLRYRPLSSSKTAINSILSFPLSISELFGKTAGTDWISASSGDLKSFSSVNWNRIGFNLEKVESTGGLHRKIIEGKSDSKSILLQGKIYDMGGLCDANVIPWGSLLTDSDLGSKSYSYAVNPEKIPGLGRTTTKQMGQWLAGKGPSDGDTLKKRLQEYHRSGFLTIDFQGRGFLSRRDLLSFMKAYDIDPRSSEVLGTFSREMNSPSVRPVLNGSTFTTFASSDLFTFKYLEECDDPWTSAKPRKFNRDLTLLSTKSSQKAGDRVSIPRFPLRKLDLLENAPENIGKDSEIYRYFGITRTKSDEPWIYSAGGLDELGNTKIYQLNDPAFLAQNRSPNFFETLQAGILAGSLGQNSNSNDLRTANVDMYFSDAAINAISTPSHIFKIGLNIIDQWDQDRYPTVLQITGKKINRPCAVGTFASVYTQNQQQVTLVGQEGLPQVSEINLFAYRPPVGSSVTTFSGTTAQNLTRDYLGTWIFPEFWAIENLINSSGSTPSQFRFSIPCGQIRTWPFNNPFAEWGFWCDYSANPCSITFQLDRSKVVTPHISDSSVTSIVSASHAFLKNSIPTGLGGSAWYGIPTRMANIPDYRATGAPLVPAVNPARTGIQVLGGSNTVSMVWSYLKKGKSGSASSDWQEMQPLEGLFREFAYDLESSDNNAGNNNVNPAFSSPTRVSPSLGTIPALSGSLITSDPRGSRIGYFYCSPTFVNSDSSPNSHPWFGISTSFPKTSTDGGTPFGALFPPFVVPISSNWRVSFNGTRYNNTSMIDYADNRSTGYNPHGSFSPLKYYKDNDGIIRRADGNAQYGVYPNRPDTDLSARPIILNRAFKNVAEMGYAYRDLPWKTLDFFSPNSPDQALLDLFTLEEEPEIVAGKFNLHSTSKEIFEALLDGTEIDPLMINKISSGSSIDEAKIAEGLDKLKDQIENKSDLVSQLATVFPESAQADTTIKWRRESVIRALVPSLQTRTWNLCLDLHCQVTSLQKNATSYGSRARVWVSVAIDRYTGNIIDQQTEWIP